MGDVFYRKVESVISVPHGDETFLAHPETGQYFHLNADGAAIWRALEQGACLPRIGDERADDGTVAEGPAFLPALRHHDLIVAQPGRAGETAPSGPWPYPGGEPRLSIGLMRYAASGISGDADGGKTPGGGPSGHQSS
jgi:hypothetical protein